jgi:Na+:H+ antiporter, NhaA family
VTQDSNYLCLMKQTRLFIEFLDSEKAGGLILVFVTILSLILANSPFQNDYINFWKIDFVGHTIVEWINDGFMTIFFLLIGLELEREIYAGELSTIKKASLPIFAALGGMLVPFGFYLFLNFGTDTQSGSGIPMATDIAFAIGILSLLGSRVPISLKIFLTALAVIDDLGAIIVIAIFYTTGLAFLNLFIALGIFAFLLVLNRLNVHNLIPYIIGGVIMWYFMLHSGVHATITGVLLAFAIPFGDGGEKSPSFIVQHFLHKPVAFIILPLFALSNTCLAIDNNWLTNVGQTNSIGIIVGLVIGKPLGIWLFAYIAVGLGISAIPSDLKWKNIFGAGLLGGIGFTMSIFITLMAFDKTEIINSSKIAILIASFIAGAIGYIWLNRTLKTVIENTD